MSGLLAELCGRVDADLSESMRNGILSARFGWSTECYQHAYCGMPKEWYFKCDQDASRHTKQFVTQRD